MAAQKFAELICRCGGEVLANSGVTRIASKTDEIVLETVSGVIHARFVVNCTGLRSDRIASMSGASLGLRIVPFRREYYEIGPAKHHMIREPIYPVRDPRIPFLGGT